jgi:hypothetical protein
MSSDFSELQETFGSVGVSRGSMNGKPLHLVADPDGGEHRSFGQMEILSGLRAYEKRKGKRRSWSDSMFMQMRAGVAEARARKKAAERA